MTKLICLFILFFSIAASAQDQADEEKETLTPAAFKSMLKAIKNSDANAETPDVEGFKAADQDGEAALAYLTGALERRSGDFNGAKKSLRSAKEILDTLATQPKFKSAYAYTDNDLEKELALTLDDEFFSEPLADLKAIENSVKINKPLMLSYSNDRAYAGTPGDDWHYRVDSIVTFCKQARTLYPKQTYKFQGKTLKIEYLKASYGSDVIYDHCDQKRAAILESGRRESSAWDRDGTIPGWYSTASVVPFSVRSHVVGPV